ncbi:uncharacterized protein LOC135583278 isoform X1 [Musa acuminata AAA Group]|uniref:uncharacterized protein LOC135583278 isoform X1 n=1 Tax=Musa acuminata AAA Group TaxID=214697 RepID=UPI0031D97100
MAYRTPVAIQNENFHIHIGKDVDKVKGVLPKPAKSGRPDRKALKDLSNTGKPPASRPVKVLALKEKSAPRGWETIKNAPKSTSLTDEEIKRCHQWAKEGIEQTHFTGNDIQKLEKDINEERINKKVLKVVSDLHEWLSASYDLGLPEKELSKDITDVKTMELETELLPCITKSPSPGLFPFLPSYPVMHIRYEEVGNLLESEVDHLQFLERPIELELKEED